MPWCETCSRFLNPNTLGPDGTCPACGRQVAEPGEPAATGQRTPWHFKLLVLATAVYLGWRFVELLEWVIGRF
jgi:hypothetical protein